MAETVETRTRAAWLAKLKVTFGQGHLFGKPAPLAISMNSACSLS